MRKKIQKQVQVVLGLKDITLAPDCKRRLGLRSRIKLSKEKLPECHNLWGTNYFSVTLL